jgi:hypothetical protein
MTENASNDDLRDRLLGGDSWSPEQREIYESRVQALLVGRLTPLRRWSLVAICAALIGLSILTGWLAATAKNLPTIARVCLVEGTVVQLVAFAYCSRILRNGVFHRRRHPNFISGLMWCFAVVLSIHFLILIPAVPDVRFGMVLLGIALVTLAGAGMQLVRTCIEQSELNTHERLLEIALRLSNGSDQAK